MAGCLPAKIDIVTIKLDQSLDARLGAIGVPGSNGFGEFRITDRAAWAHLCAVAPIPASSGKTQNRHRLSRGGDPQANHALWRIVITRLGSHPATRAYVTRSSKEGLSKKEIIRCPNRYAAREVYPHLRG